MVRLFDGLEYEERYGEEVGTCNKHKIQVVDRSCDLCEDELNEQWLCNECNEVRIDDARVEANMKCGECAYG